MNERLTTRTLAELLADQTSLDRKRAEEFINAISSYFLQCLERNKVVKIFGLGVFKIVLVRERESVHIQTGERFVIPAHHKLTFFPDKDFREQINRPFALFEPIEAIETEMLTPNDKTINIDDYDLGYLQDEDSIDESYVEDPLTEAFITEEDSPEPDSSGPDEVPEEAFIPDEALQEAFLPDEIFLPDEDPQEAFLPDEVQQEAFLPDEMVYEPSVPLPFSSETKRKKALFWFYVLVIPLCVVLGIGGGTYIFLKMNSDRSIHAIPTKAISEAAPETAITEAVPETAISEAAPETAVNSPLPVGDVPVSDNINPVPTPSTRKPEVRSNVEWIAPSSVNVRTESRRVIPSTREMDERNRPIAATPGNAARIANESSRNTTQTTAPTSAATNSKSYPARVKMSAGQTLTQIAAEYYGDKVFWVYIYEHNKSRIKNPDNIPAGTELQIPAPNTYGIDAKNNASLMKARQKQDQLQKKKN